jgi:hypothetical protein
MQEYGNCSQYDSATTRTGGRLMVWAVPCRGQLQEQLPGIAHRGTKKQHTSTMFHLTCGCLTVWAVPSRGQLQVQLPRVAQNGTQHEKPGTFAVKLPDLWVPHGVGSGLLAPAPGTAPRAACASGADPRWAPPRGRHALQACNNMSAHQQH